MSRKTLRNSVLALLACVSMIALGWTAAKIAGPPAPTTTTAQEPNAPSLGFLARLFGGKRFDLSGLAAWKGKSPDEVLNGHSLLDHPNFVAAAKATMGEERYRMLKEEMAGGSRFITNGVEQDGQVLRVYLTNLMVAKAFRVIFFIDTKQGFIDVFWGVGLPDEDIRSEMLLHTGERFPVETEHGEVGLEHAHLASAGAYAAYLNDQQSKFLGTWSGTFDTRNGRARIQTRRTIAVTGDPTKPGGLKFRQEEDMRVSNAVFTCNNSPKLVRIFEGTVGVANGEATFIPDTITDPQCGKYVIFSYKYRDGILVRTQGDGGEPLTRVD